MSNEYPTFCSELLPLVFSFINLLNIWFINIWPKFKKRKNGNLIINQYRTIELHKKKNKAL